MTLGPDLEAVLDPLAAVAAGITVVVRKEIPEMHVSVVIVTGTGIVSVGDLDLPVLTEVQAGEFI